MRLAAWTQRDSNNSNGHWQSRRWMVFTVPDENDGVLDAASRFVAQGGQWRPSNDLAQRIDDMALGKA